MPTIDGMWFSMNLKEEVNIDFMIDDDSLWPLEAWLLSTSHNMAKQIYMIYQHLNNDFQFKLMIQHALEK
jgi:hypothetical protein